MIHIYKAGGDWEKDGIKYTVKIVSFYDLDEYLYDGWVRTFEDLNDSIPESGSDYETELRSKIKALGGSPAGRSSIKTLENQLAKLEQADGDEA